ncbi:glutamate 5-kinase, related [Neospora caninum Liverpool]|uniref:Glutamate 5-kinase, related n=1 Tax=Neospora caninum (strain Liverpool) TaxID=572307 RepID=F0VBG3_NEOCL|nr:glutamate 5-kinase, related [Neospora caninum Liverpool]CBZ50947.1 glutamate 5-kinase, related [Neospora caninum Liverpool]|eukprot:XP_003880980.1 glutamate 5-kinase, related [Neospora caninum Liverpool]
MLVSTPEAPDRVFPSSGKRISAEGRDMNFSGDALAGARRGDGGGGNGGEEVKPEKVDSKCDAGPVLPPGDASKGCLVVVKIGTSTLLTATKDRMSMNLSNLGRFVDTICELRARGHTVVVVSSGAVGAGCVTLRLKQRPENLNTKQALAAVGQCRLMRLYEDLFSVREERVAQMLLSRHDLLHQKSYQNFQAALKALLALDVIPIINENDSLATEQLRFGDNDTLAAHIAVAVDAQWLFILTDVDCLFDRNPHKHPDARPVAFVNRLTDVYAFLSDGDCGAWGTGGMYTKVIASKIATNVGVHVAISNGKYPERILDMLEYARQSETHPEALRRGDLFPLRSPVRERPFVRGSCRAEETAEAAEGQEERREQDEETGKKKEKKFAKTRQDETGAPQQWEREDGGESERPATGSTACEKGKKESESPETVPAKFGGPETRDREGGTGGKPERFETAGTSSRGETWEADEGGGLGEPEREDVEQRGELEEKGGKEQHRRNQTGEALDSGAGEAGGQPFSSLMICDNLQQMPFLGTVFIAKDRRLHRKGDTRGWILSLPVRGKVFIDPGAVAALVQQKKSLFAAGVHHVSGNFSANECVAIYITSLSRGSKRLTGGSGGTKSTSPPREQGIPSGPQKRGTFFGERQNSTASQRSDDLPRLRNGASASNEDALDPSLSASCPLVSSDAPAGLTHVRSAGCLSESRLEGSAAASPAASSPVFSASPCPIECLEIARCISNVSSSELKIIKGRKSSEFRDLLGYAVDEEVAHRQHIVFTFMNGHEALKSFCLAKHAKFKFAEKAEAPLAAEALDGRTGD